MIPVLPGYPSTSGGYDEALAPDGSIRPAWQVLDHVLTELGPVELDRRRRDAGRLVEAQGAGHLFHDDGSDASRPWRLDPLPFVVTGDEWAVLEAGIAQRARLLELVLHDLYGPQHLVRGRGLEPAAVYGTPAFCEPAHALDVPTTTWLTTYGADLVRTADGAWRVLRDHTDAPVGAGYALLNREVLGILVPELSRTARPLAPGPFFAAYRDALSAVAPPGTTSPRVIVLSPGRGHPSFFEHSYLATSLGYHLAEVGDLSISAGRAWLRSIGGVEPVDVLLRRMDDAHADPLEQPGAEGGVPGLLHAARGGGVAVANAIGSGLAGSLTLQHALPDLASVLLGEPLRLANLEALWCGRPDDRATVVADPSRLVLHDVGAPDGGCLPSVFGDEMDDETWLRWRRLLEVAPHRVVAQPRIRFATTPVLTGDGAVPGTVVLRVHAVLGPTGITVLPGGLGRVVDASQPVVNQQGELAKDVWVLDDRSQRPLPSFASRPARMPQVDLGGSLPVRTAESLTWAARHAERAEALARTVRSALGMVQGDPTLLTAADGAWRQLVTRGLLRLSQQPGDHESEVPWREAVVVAEAALARRLEALALAASGVRSFQSSSTWMVLGELGALAVELRADREVGELRGMARRVEDLDAVVMRLAAISGFALESTVRGPAWRYLDLGRRLERALVVLDSLDPSLGPATPAVVRADVFDHVLRSNESLIAYRRRFRSDVELPSLLDLLVHDTTNPRSLQFQLDALREHLVALSARDLASELPALVDDACRAVLAADPLVVDSSDLVATMVDGTRMALGVLNSRLLAVHFADPVVLRPMGTHW